MSVCTKKYRCCYNLPFVQIYSLLDKDNKLFAVDVGHQSQNIQQRKKKEEAGMVLLIRINLIFTFSFVLIKNIGLPKKAVRFT